MPTIQLNGEDVEVRPGKSLLLAVLQAGEFIPHLCFHPALSSPVSCRLCVAELGEGDNAVLMPTCNQPVIGGMVVTTDSHEVVKARADVIEFLLKSHPLDCPTCPKAGECELQDYADAHGSQSSDNEWTPRSTSNERLGSRLAYYPSRCIACSRCSRFSEEVSGDGDLTLAHRGEETVISLSPGHFLGDGLVGNTVDICPVGALVDPDSQLDPPPWMLTGINSICPGCSSGCNIRVDVFEGSIRRLKPRANLEVNQYWMCDEGRFGWREIQRHERLVEPCSGSGDDEKAVSWDLALDAARQGLSQAGEGGDELAVVLNGNLTNEETYLLLRLARDEWHAGLICMDDGKYGQERVFKSGFTIRADRTPNRRGVREIAKGLGIDLGSTEMLGTRLRNGELKRAFVVASDNLVEQQAAGNYVFDDLDFLVVGATAPSSLTKAAHLVLPMLTAFEKDGTLTNHAGRVQRIRVCTPGPSTVPEDWQTLGRLATNDQFDFKQLDEILVAMSREIGGLFSGLSFERLQQLEQDDRAVGQAYGAGWSDRLQQWGFLHVDDHRK